MRHLLIVLTLVAGAAVAAPAAMADPGGGCRPGDRNCGFVGNGGAAKNRQGQDRARPQQGHDRQESRQHNRGPDRADSGTRWPDMGGPNSQARGPTVVTPRPDKRGQRDWDHDRRGNEYRPDPRIIRRDGPRVGDSGRYGRPYHPAPHGRLRPPPRGYEYRVLDNRIVLVDSTTLRIVAIAGLLSMILNGG